MEMGDLVCKATKIFLYVSSQQKEWREDRHGAFKRKVARCVRKSQETAFE